MADLIVVYTRVGNDPIEVGSAARTENIAIGADSAPGSLAAAGDENAVSLYAGADCWVAVGLSPVAAANSSPSRFLKSGTYLPLSVTAGQTVAVVQG